MAAPDTSVSFDSWPAILIGLMAASTAFLVPFTGFMKTWFEYRIEARKAEALKAEPAREVAAGAGGAMFDSMAISDLTVAVKELTVAIRNGAAVDEANRTDRLASVITRMTEAIDQWEERQPAHRRPNRRDRDHG